MSQCDRLQTTLRLLLALGLHVTCFQDIKLCCCTNMLWWLLTSTPVLSKYILTVVSWWPMYSRPSVVTCNTETVRSALAPARSWPLPLHARFT